MAGKFGKNKTAALYDGCATTIGTASNARFSRCGSGCWNSKRTAGARCSSLAPRRGTPRHASFHESIAKADYGFDLRSGDAELGTQTADVYVDRSCFDEVLVAPHALEQPIAREHAPLVFHEEAQQLELAPREPYRLSVHGHGDGIEIG